jgi:uncharacterized protein YjiS (DUF1127 family)
MEVISNIRSWNNARRVSNELNKLSDRELFDIGIHRSNIASVARGFGQRSH